MPRAMIRLLSLELQRGRTRESAESPTRCAGSIPSKWRFNGAALVRVRRGQGPWAFPKAMNQLQRGRTRESAESSVQFSGRLRQPSRFNGAALVRVRRGIIYLSEPSSVFKLQRGRTRESAERALPCQRIPTRQLASTGPHS